MNVFGLRSICLSLFAALVATSMAGCEPEGGASIEGASPQEAATLTAEVSCAYLTRCGVSQTTCSDSTSPGDDEDCETVSEPINMEECLGEAEGILGEGFACADLDADLRALVDECLAAFETSECLGPDDADAALGMPEVCADALEAVLECTGGGENTAEPAPRDTGAPAPSE